MRKFLLALLLLVAFRPSVVLGHEAVLKWKPVKEYTDGTPLGAIPMYQIWRATVPDMKNALRVGEVSEGLFVDPMIHPNAVYYYTVVCVVRQGVSVRTLSVPSVVVKVVT